MLRFSTISIFSRVCTMFSGKKSYSCTAI